MITVFMITVFISQYSYHSIHDNSIHYQYPRDYILEKKSFVNKKLIKFTGEITYISHTKGYTSYYRRKTNYGTPSSIDFEPLTQRHCVSRDLQAFVEKPKSVE
jgi:hypothetical protein